MYKNIKNIVCISRSDSLMSSAEFKYVINLESRSTLMIFIIDIICRWLDDSSSR